MKLLTTSITILLLLTISACGIRTQPEFSIFLEKPVWLSGIQVDGLNYTKSFPLAIDNKYMKVVRAGYWLANTNGKLSQLVYIFKLTNNRVFPQDLVYTKSIFSNPEDESKPIIYYGTLNNKFRTTTITHGSVYNVAMNQTYHMVFEAYSDPERTQLITRIDQALVSP